MARLARVALAVLLISHLSPLEAAAQSVAASYDDLRPLLERGMRVVVTDLHGKQTTGRVSEVRSDGFVLATGIRRSAAFGDGLLTARWRSDSVRNGVFLGLGIGAVTGGLAFAGLCDPSSDCSSYGGGTGMFGYGALIGGSIGAGLGALIDRLHTRRELVVEYRWLPNRPRSLRVEPRVDRRRLGLAAMLQF
jgi:hypothetical protein